VSDPDLADLGRRFTEDMRRGLVELARLGYQATYFRRMLAEVGAVEAARRLVMARDLSSGLWRLHAMRKLDMSVEMWTLLPWYEPLFAPETRREAERKLRQLGVNVPAERDRLIRRLGEPR
jgi:hypothetical protein